jgi:acetyl esterase
MNAPGRREEMVRDAQTMTVHEMQVCGAEGPLDARLYKAETDGRRDTLIVFFHGGGFVDGDLDQPDSFLRRMAAASGFPLVLSSSYTLAPIKPFPAAVEDAYAVLLWAKKHKTRLGWTGERMLVAGIEAGANLAAVAALMSRDRIRPQLAGQILIMPMLDPSLSSASMREMPSTGEETRLLDECAAAYRAYLPHVADRGHPYASPLQSSRLKSLPPALILSTEGDPLRDEAEAYGAKLIGAGVPATLRRLRSAPLHGPNGRNESACRCQVLAEIAGFIAALDSREARQG